MYIFMINTGYWQIQSEKSTWKKSINLGKKLWTDVKAQNDSWVEWIPHLNVSTFYMTVYISSTQSLNPRNQNMSKLKFQMSLHASIFDYQ